MRRWNLYKTFFSAFFIFFIPAKAQAIKCFVVSGYDEAFTIHQEVFSSKSRLADMDCKVVNGWKELAKTIRKEKIPEQERILIVQGAHGSSNGYFKCKSGIESNAEVLDTLERISKTHPVGAVIESCYSGNLLSDKLVRDAEKKTSSADRLCLATASLFGRVAYISESDPISMLKKAKKGQNLEEALAPSKEVMLSSAAWDSTGITEILVENKFENSLAVLQKMNQVTSCSSNSMYCTSAAVCAHPDATEFDLEVATSYWASDLKPGTTDEIFRKIRDLAKQEARYGDYDRSIFQDWEKSLLSWADNIENLNSASCLRKLKNDVSLWSGSLGATVSTQQVRDWMIAFCRGTAGGTCQEVFQCHQSPKVEGVTLSRMGFPNKFSRSDLYSSILDYENGSFDQKNKYYQQALKELKSNSPSTASQKEWILKSILGKGPPHVAAKQALLGFLQGSLAMKKYPVLIDEQRRNACRSFKLE